jgi:hypothetical protein
LSAHVSQFKVIIAKLILIFGCLRKYLTFCWSSGGLVYLCYFGL